MHDENNVSECRFFLYCLVKKGNYHQIPNPDQFFLPPPRLNIQNFQMTMIISRPAKDSLRMPTFPTPSCRHHHLLRKLK